MKAYAKLSQEDTSIFYVDLPTPSIEKNELLVKTKAVGVGVHDEYFYPTGVKYPYVIGIEGSGIVEKIGANVSNYKIGERIAFINSLNKKGGTWAEYTTFPESSLIVRIPKEMSFIEAASLPVVGNTILKAFHALKLKPGDNLFIAGGSGAIGTLGIQIGKQKGYKVIASASKINHEYMKSLGAEIVVDYHDTDWKEQIKKLSPEEIDGCIAIQPGTAKECSAVVKNGGVVVAVSGDQQELERNIRLEQIPHMIDVTDELTKIFDEVIKKTIHLTLQEYPFSEGIQALENVKTRHERGKSVLILK